MRHASVYRVGGYALLASAIALGVGILLHPQQPETLKAASGDSMGTWVLWVLSHWLLILGLAGATAGWIALARHFEDTQLDGWMLLALAATVLGSAALIGVFAPKAIGYPMLLDMYRAGGKQTVSEHVFVALGVASTGLALAGGLLYWLGVGLFALAMTRESGWPSWLGFSGLGVGVVNALAGFVLLEQFGLYRFVLVLGFAWIGTAGFHLARRAPNASAADDRTRPMAAAVGMR